MNKPDRTNDSFGVDRMDWITCWEVLDQANRGICIYNGKLQNIYINDAARNLFKAMAPELSRQLRDFCWRFLALVRANETGLLNYSGRLIYEQTFISFNCFSFEAEAESYVLVAFEYEAGEEQAMLAIELTQREREIVQAISEGKTNREISEVLCIGFETVKSHIRNLLAKTKSGSRTELVSKFSRYLS